MSWHLVKLRVACALLQWGVRILPPSIGSQFDVAHWHLREFSAEVRRVVGEYEQHRDEVH